MVSWTVDDPPAKPPGLTGEPSKQDVAVLRKYLARAFRRAEEQDPGLARLVLRRAGRLMVASPAEVATGEGPKPGRPLTTGCEEYGHVLVNEAGKASKGRRAGSYHCIRKGCAYTLVVR
jgi:hypothetical protein